MINQNICIYGPPGSGKSTVGRLLARNLALPFVDLDGEIEVRQQKSVRDIFSSEGEPAFRSYEREELQKLLSGNAQVIALGGGTLVNNQTRQIVEASALVVLLDACLDILDGRLQRGARPGVRPLLAGDDPRSRLQSLLEQRKDHYASFPLRLNTGSLDPGQAAWEVQKCLGLFHIRGMSHTLTASSVGGAAFGADAKNPSVEDYDVIVQSGGLHILGELLRQRHLSGPLVLVSDQKVAPHYAGQVKTILEASGYQVSLALVEPGEEHKTMQTIFGLWQSFMDAAIERSSTIIALGGGVVTDQAGFAAATYLRGVRWVAVPTTLLAMVDASLGGKTGVDLPQGKNLVGAFHAPALVLAAPDTLATLPVEELRSGLAETVKHGILGDPYLLDCCARLKNMADPLEMKARLPEIVRRGMAVKVKVIEADPFEHNQRAGLNLGHTIGHAIELASGFQLRHGEAVAIGMVIEARLAEELGIADKGLSDTIAGLLSGLGLPVQIPADLDQEIILKAIELDKKRAGRKVRFALPVRVGEVKLGVEVDDERRKHALDFGFARS